MATLNTNSPGQPPRLHDVVRQTDLAQIGHGEVAQSYVDWTRRYVLFHQKQHPRTLGLDAVAHFLEQVAQTECDPLSALEKGHEALTFLYHVVLGQPGIGELPFPDPPRLLDPMRRALRLRLYSVSTEQNYVRWIERFIRFHGMRHPNTMAPEIEQFLTDLAIAHHVSAGTQNQAFSALIFLYQQVLKIGLPPLDAIRARRPKRLPTVLSPEEVRQFLECGGEFTLKFTAHPVSRQRDRAGRAFARIACKADLPAVGEDDGAGDAQAQAGAAHLPAAGLVHPVKPLEDVGQMVSRDAHAVVVTVTTTHESWHTRAGVSTPTSGALRRPVVCPITT